MSGFDEISIRITSGGTRGQRGGKRQRCEWDCAYCRGIGVDPYGMMGNEKCPACLGGRY